MDDEVGTRASRTARAHLGLQAAVQNSAGEMRMPGTYNLKPLNNGLEAPNGCCQIEYFYVDLSFGE
jgi:hypothetical protein